MHVLGAARASEVALVLKQGSRSLQGTCRRTCGRTGTPRGASVPAGHQHVWQLESCRPTQKPDTHGQQWVGLQNMTPQRGAAVHRGVAGLVLIKTKGLLHTVHVL